MSAQCGTCGQPVHDVGILCAKCTGKLRRQLLDVTELDMLTEIEITITRQNVTGNGAGESGSAVPFDPEASARAAHLRARLTKWTRTLLGNSDHVWPQDPAAWLADQTNTIRLRDWAKTCQDELGAAIEAVRASIDTPAQLAFVARCGAQIFDPYVGREITCGRVIWARPDAGVGHCKCGNTVDRKEAQVKLLDDARDEVYPTTTLVRLLGACGLSVPAGTIRQWKARGDLHQVNPISSPRPLYRVGDVLDLALRHVTHHEKLQVSAP